MQSRRIMVELTPEQQARLAEARRQVERELPDLVTQGRALRKAADEPTLSGELRRALHASELSLARIANEAGITPLQLDEFLTGEATLPSDAIDRLAALLGYELSRAK